jgi:VanZ family protein
MLPLRYPRVWLALGWLLVLSVAIASLVPASVLRAITVSDKIEHAGSYFLLMIWFAGLYRRSSHPWIALGLLLLGIGLEVLQLGTTTRTFDVRDMLADAAGILLGLVLSMWLLEGWCQRLERGLRLKAG